MSDNSLVTSCCECNSLKFVTLVDNKYFCSYHLVELAWCDGCNLKFVEGLSEDYCDKCYNLIIESPNEIKLLKANRTHYECEKCGEYLQRCQFCERTVELCQKCSYDEYKSKYCDWCI